MSKLRQFKYLCPRCKNIFSAHTNAYLDPEYEVWYKGFMCNSCIEQHTLDSKEVGDY